MTCHVALASAEGAVLLADSQLSDDRAESHGAQKIFAGSDFLVGGAGRAVVLNAVFAELANDPTAGLEAALTAVSTAAGASSVRFIVVKEPTGHPVPIQLYLPDVLKRSSPWGGFGTIGSGAEFVWAARARDLATGGYQTPTRLEDMFVRAIDYMDAANQSLTVDEHLMAGFLIAGKTYLVGDATVQPVHVPPKVAAEWSAAAKQFSALRDAAGQLLGEYRTAEAVLSTIQSRPLHPAEVNQLAVAGQTAEIVRQALRKQMDALFAWFDARR